MSGHAAAPIMTETSNNKTSSSSCCLSDLTAAHMVCAICAHLAADDFIHCLLPSPNRHCLAWMNKSQKALPLLLQRMGKKHLESRVLKQDSFEESGTMQSHALAHILR